MSNTISTLRFLIIQETKNFQKKRIGRVHHIVVEIDFHFYCFITFRFALSLILCCQLLNHTFSPAHLCMVIHKQGVPKKKWGGRPFGIFIVISIFSCDYQDIFSKTKIILSCEYIQNETNLPQGRKMYDPELLWWGVNIWSVAPPVIS